MCICSSSIFYLVEWKQRDAYFFTLVTCMWPRLCLPRLHRRFLLIHFLCWNPFVNSHGFLLLLSCSSHSRYEVVFGTLICMSMSMYYYYICSVCIGECQRAHISCVSLSLPPTPPMQCARIFFSVVVAVKQHRFGSFFTRDVSVALGARKNDCAPHHAHTITRSPSIHNMHCIYRMYDNVASQIGISKECRRDISRPE